MDGRSAESGRGLAGGHYTERGKMERGKKMMMEGKSVEDPGPSPDL